jgi:hypothetical protein
MKLRIAILGGLLISFASAWLRAETDEEVEAHKLVLDLTGAFSNVVRERGSPCSRVSLSIVSSRYFANRPGSQKRPLEESAAADPVSRRLALGAPKGAASGVLAGLAFSCAGAGPMGNARAAALTWSADASAAEYTATLSIPSSAHARMMRGAISPRLAISRRRIIASAGPSGVPRRLPFLEERAQPFLSLR